MSDTVLDHSMSYLSDNSECGQAGQFFTNYIKPERDLVFISRLSFMKLQK
jgi:hypothetical protein